VEGNYTDGESKYTAFLYDDFVIEVEDFEASKLTMRVAGMSRCVFSIPTYHDYTRFKSSCCLHSMCDLLATRTLVYNVLK
jgi:hypothetical protein